MASFYANPYDTSYSGFYFDSAEDYEKKAEAHPAEEFEIDFIDGSAAEAEVAEQLRVMGHGINQTNLAVWFDQVEYLSEYEQAQLTIQADRAGPQEDLESIIRDASDVDLREGTLEDLAYEYVDEGIIDPANYFDEEAFGRDIRMEGSHAYHLHEELEDAELREDEDEIARMKAAIEEAENMSDREIGEHYVEMAGDVRELGTDTISQYVDYDAVARDLAHDYTEEKFAGTTYVVSR